MTMRQKVVITGASQRIGLFLAGYLLSLNYDVIAVVRNAKRELQALKILNPERVTIIHKDFNESSIDKSFWESIISSNVVGFIHCASTFKYDTVETTNEKVIKEQQNVNCNVFIDACTSYCQVKKQVNNEPMSFIAFLDAKLDRLNNDHYSYTLSKLQLQASIPFLAMSCSPKARVNAVSPGLVLRSGNQTEEEFKHAQESLPFGFGVELEDVAQTVAFLLMQTKTTGQIITLDAGQHLQSDRDIIFRNNQ
jgi:NAD(P)-dependent dehydrogenase (short-subunit alcohol dehydrogenase family)